METLSELNVQRIRREIKRFRYNLTQGYFTILTRYDFSYPYNQSLQMQLDTEKFYLFKALVDNSKSELTHQEIESDEFYNFIKEIEDTYLNYTNFQTRKCLMNRGTSYGTHD